MDIRAFQGWHYNPSVDDGDVSTRIAPPYDVLKPEDKAALLAGCEQNVVAVDLPHVPPWEAGPDETYRQAARLLDQWKASGVLTATWSPAIYVYEQEFAWAGRNHARRALICGVRAASLGGDVKPHEHTYPGPKADRLKLTQHTRTQLSPVFGFYDEPSGMVADQLAGVASGRPHLHGVLNGVRERLWICSDADAIQEVSAALRDKPVFIADGHHRYTTALNYRDSFGVLPADHPANFVMFALVAMDDPGLLVLPTHRVFRNLKPGFSAARLADAATEFDWKRVSVADIDLADADAFLKRYGAGAMGILDADPAELWIARLKDPAAMRQAAPAQNDIWRSLDVAVLHKLIVDKALAPWRGDDLAVDYTPDAGKVLAACNAGSGQLGVLLQGTPLSAVRDLAMAGEVMPHKSTYFYPKLATGMVFKPLE